MKKLYLSVIILSTFFILVMCSNNTIPEKDSNILSIQITNGNKEELVSTPQFWHVTNKRICVLFGYDFNDPKIVEEYTAFLSEQFGLDEDGGLIYPLVYPTDFKHGTKGYVNDFLTNLQDDEKDFCGVVLLGAPEKTHSALAKNQDKWNQEVPYPVIALFPQDEILGIEATCDIVLDKGQSAELTGGIVSEEIESLLIKEAPDVLSKTIKYMLTLDGSLSADSSIQTHISQMLKGYNIHHYIDPETGLQSINHFVLN